MCGLAEKRKIINTRLSGISPLLPVRTTNLKGTAIHHGIPGRVEMGAYMDTLPGCHCWSILLMNGRDGPIAEVLNLTIRGKVFLIAGRKHNAIATPHFRSIERLVRTGVKAKRNIRRGRFGHAGGECNSEIPMFL